MLMEISLQRIIRRTGLYFEGDGRVGQITLCNLSTLSILSAPDMSNYAWYSELDLELKDLPFLESIAIPSLNIISNMTLYNLPKLTNFFVYAQNGMPAL
jgi:hypothetical protein